MEGFKTITHEELKKWMGEKKSFALLDVLSQESYAARHLPGALHADSSESDFIEKTETLVPEKETPVVVYCGSFTCQKSPKAAQRLIEAGYIEVYDFEGGLADWKDTGYPLEGEAP